MSNSATRRVGFAPRQHPLLVSALYAEGAAAISVLGALLQATPARLTALRAVGTAGCVVLLGPAAELPWADGVIYLGQDPRAPRLLLPTYYEADVPLDLLERRILDAADPSPAPPVAVLPHARRLIALGHARVPSREGVRAWLARAASATR